MTVDAAVVALAVHPARELPASPGTEKIEQDGVLFVFFSIPNALLVEPLELEPAGVPVAVAEARRAARERGKRGGGVPKSIHVLPSAAVSARGEGGSQSSFMSPWVKR